jgi:hypothetical protein
MAEQADLAYAAGFFDGEGCISMGEYNEHCRVQLVITNTNDEVLQWFQAIWGGRLYRATPDRTKHLENVLPRGDCWALRFHGSEAYALLREIGPYLRIKHEQADNALAFFRVQAEAKPYNRIPMVLRTRLRALVARHRELSARQAPSFAAEVVATIEAEEQLEILR